MSSTNATKSPPRADEFVGYTDDPDGRGTPSLVISCVLTLILCVWSALHLNVPPAKRSRWSDYLLSTRWILAGIYAPELVVFAAWSQWSSARTLQKLVAQSLAEEDGETKVAKYPRERRFKWTMTHSFFASTGGFVFDIEPTRSYLHDHGDQEKLQTQRLTLTARGVALLAACGRLPDVDQKQIEDKSKANDLAKALVLVQAGWMLAQVIGRLAFRLPVTLLELNTVAHVICAFAMYLFWWHKPLLPNEPLILPHDDDMDPLIAFMYSSSELSGHVDPKHVRSEMSFKKLLTYFSFYSTSPEFETICFRTKTSHLSQSISTSDLRGSGDATNLDRSNINVQAFLADPTLHIVEAPPSCMERLQSATKSNSTVLFERRPRVANSHRPLTPMISQPTQNRWSLLLRALRTHPDLLLNNIDRISLAHSCSASSSSSSSSCAPPSPTLCIHLFPSQLLSPSIPNWPSNDLLRSTDGTVIGSVLWFANFAYGGIHAAAWNEHFPTLLEKWLWRGSASYIAFSGGLWVLLNLAVSRSTWLDGYWEGFVDGRKPWWQYGILGLVMGVCGASLVFARVYMLVEAFVSIRELPAGAYETPRWSQVFPHF